MGGGDDGGCSAGGPHAYPRKTPLFSQAETADAGEIDI